MWEELYRRDSADFQFTTKPQKLSEVAIAPSRMDDFDDLRQAIVQAGIEKPGFDRTGMRFHDAERAFLVSCFGTDETGQLRDKRDES